MMRTSMNNGKVAYFTNKICNRRKRYLQSDILKSGALRFSCVGAQATTLSAVTEGNGTLASSTVLKGCALSYSSLSSPLFSLLATIREFRIGPQSQMFVRFYGTRVLFLE